MIKDRMNKGSHRGRWTALLVIAVLAAVYCGWAVRRPLPAVPAITPASTARTVVPGGKGLAWPAGEQAAVGIAGTGIMETHGKQTGMPTASTAKMITVLCVLQKKPLAPGQQGPTITLTQNDVNIYNDYVAKDGSLVPVKAGEKITEYQMLEAILLPSANNMADSLAIWAFGSLANYSAYGNGYVTALGLKDTHIGPDASGFNPATKSSARDLARLGSMVMQNPVLSGIVAKPTASGIPVAGKIRNVNFLLGTDGIIGVKTGNTDQAGGVFVGAAKKTVNGKQVTIITAVMRSHDIFSVLKSSLALIKSAQNNFRPVTVLDAGTVVGRYDFPWGASVTAATDQAITLDGWAGSSIPFTVKLDKVPAGAGMDRTVGTVSVKSSALYGRRSVPVKLTASPAPPSVRWRLSHPIR